MGIPDGADEFLDHFHGLGRGEQTVFTQEFRQFILGRCRSPHEIHNRFEGLQSLFQNGAVQIGLHDRREGGVGPILEAHYNEFMDSAKPAFEGLFLAVSIEHGIRFLPNHGNEIVSAEDLGAERPQIGKLTFINMDEHDPRGRQ